VRVLQTIIENGPSASMARMGFLMTHLTNELADELSDLDEATIRVFLFQIGEVIAWIGHGDNDRLPDEIRSFAESVQPSPPRENADTDAHISIDSPTG
jgi:hypothetical protein